MAIKNKKYSPNNLAVFELILYVNLKLNEFQFLI